MRPEPSLRGLPLSPSIVFPQSDIIAFLLRFLTVFCALIGLSACSANPVPYHSPAHRSIVSPASLDVSTAATAFRQDMAGALSPEPDRARALEEALGQALADYLEEQRIAHHAASLDTQTLALVETVSQTAADHTSGQVLLPARASDRPWSVYGLAAEQTKEPRWLLHVAIEDVQDTTGKRVVDGLALAAFGHSDTTNGSAALATLVDQSTGTVIWANHLPVGNGTRWGPAPKMSLLIQTLLDEAPL